jgi:hypothetical protein
MWSLLIGWSDLYMYTNQLQSGSKGPPRLAPVGCGEVCVGAWVGRRLGGGCREWRWGWAWGWGEGVPLESRVHSSR